jgi:hypothetical protein
MKLRPANLGYLVSGLGLEGASALFGLAFHDRYWRWRDCFNELGRCYDPLSPDVYLEQAGIVWGGLATICFVCGAIVLSRMRVARSKWK